MTDKLKELLQVAQAMRDWIDAVPKDTTLPAMPGFDRDWADYVIAKAADSIRHDALQLRVTQEGYKCSYHA